MMSFSGLAVGDLDTPQQVQGLDVTPSLFRMLRVQPQVGRIFSEDEGEEGNNQKAILTHAAWHQYFAGDPAAVGRDMRFNGVLHAIVGVMPEDFEFGGPEVRIFRPIAFTAEQREAYHSNNWQQLARLRDGATVELAQQQIDAVNAANNERFPGLRDALANAGFETIVVSYQDDLVRDVRPMLFLLWGGVLFVLLIGCVNIANLVMVRASVRTKELATRFALGAGRLRVTRQLLTESVLLTALGGGLGLAFGYAGMGLLERLGIDRLPRATEIAMDGTVVAATLALALAVGVLIGVIPVAGAVRASLSSVFREEGRTGTSNRGTRLLRSGMVTAQVAIALVLLIAAGLMFASFRSIISVDVGFEPDDLLAGQVMLPTARYAELSDLRGFVNEARGRIGALPGVEAVGVTSVFPLSGSYSDSVILAEGYEMSPGESLISPAQVRASPGYLEAMGIELVRGRYFDVTDVEGSLPAVIVDERLAAKFWPGQDPLGKRLYFPTNFDDITAITEDTEFVHVVGVVEDIALRDVVGDDNDVGTYYMPYEQRLNRALTFAIRTAGDPAALINPIRAELARLDPELPFYEVATMNERIADTIGPRRTPVVLALGFALVALLLAAIGIYGVLAYLVATRRKEIGIRLALGSSAQEVFRLVLREGLVIVAVGLGVGLAGAFALRTTIASQLYGIEPLDATVWASVVGVLALVALLACWVPARRATRVDPVVALAQE
jgi:predicted permease